MSNTDRFYAMSYEDASLGDSPASPVSGASTRSLPRQDRAKVDVAPSHDPAAASALAAFDVESEDNYRPRTLKFHVVMLGLYLAIFLVALDRTIISVAIPEITDTFNSIGDVGWYGSAYMITGAAFSLMFGKIYRHYSIKTVFLGSIVCFEVGSAICGAAPTSVALIIGRAIAGLGSAGIFTGGMMVIVPLIPLHKRPVYYGFFGAVFGIASLLGPFLGGVFTDHLSWRWCFYINLPVGAFTIMSIILFLHIKTQPTEQLTLIQHLVRLDPIATLVFVPSIVCLVLGLQWGGTKYAWSDSKVIGLLVASGILFVGFWVLQVLLPHNATVPMRIVKQRSVLGGVIFLFLLNGSLFTIVYFLPIWFEAVRSETATHAGVSMLPLVISLVVMSIIAGGFTQRVGYYMPPILTSPVLTTVGAALLTELKTTTISSKWIGYQVLYGFGTGMAMQTTSMAAQTVLERSDISIGMALNFFGQNLGGAIFVPVAQTIFEGMLNKKISAIPGLNAANLGNTGVLKLKEIVPPPLIPEVQTAFNSSVTRCLFVSVALSAASILPALIMEWRNIKEGTEVKAIRDAELAGPIEQSPDSLLIENQSEITMEKKIDTKRGSVLKAEYWKPAIEKEAGYLKPAGESNEKILDRR
ncbi:uncharacterized protein A1O9_00559 [Exophiala aquamarina CBS 119918]|uniref:Major facilitator superfamily (MFS) profile domain-containing protein n=1 Tax=Exophiala aquamarina CBS 119918 TaxID=1182545 RepID=A0A072PRT0_9EURO|nr:uncharacterized protein A1O9_00559 [Exophiala aquamarina CBS 119918]KEF62586.1 hypothetical protein A1O9_00559 [Exophiala aquamarina CBS 119918]